MDAISVDLNRDLVEKATSVLNNYGIDVETAINSYLIQIISGIGGFRGENLLTEEMADETRYVRPPMQFDCLKGILEIGDDFSDVLADFEEYMW